MRKLILEKSIKAHVVARNIRKLYFLLNVAMNPKVL